MDPFNMEVTVQHKQVEFDRMRREGTAFSQFESAAAQSDSLKSRIMELFARIDQRLVSQRIGRACAD
jgi:hypothetical protein